ncbi:uncharacterized protein J8A68_001162 [[Candida] subhashii]|uniref:Uncharacterized protein n=1 Tax=[Candida] subhashii TaxID=561895 RepID=A0A8J5QGS7_9ASCO|nr:uncharacterized protein J8A68_001162 [[Candida] subhashii]KAG7665474.1 hypothetical protein J8A68_001162 [[Candida] subhashii]
MEEIILLRSADKVDFNKILRFFENTCSYITNYFTIYSGDYFRVLNNATKPWKASSLVGHKSWFDDKVVEFNLDQFSEEIVIENTTKLETAMGSFPAIIFKFVKDLLEENTPKARAGVENLSTTIVIFHNFLISLKKLEDSMDLSGYESNLIKLISKTELLTEFLSQITSIIDLSYQQHVSQLNKSDSDEDAGTLLHSWFDGCVKYASLVSITKDTTISKVDFRNCLSHIIQIFNNAIKKVEWGNFTIDSIISKFDQLKSEMNLTLWKEIDVFSTSLGSTLEKFQDLKVEKYFYLIGIISRLKEKLTNLKPPPEYEHTNIQIDDICNQMFEKLVKNTPTPKFKSLFQDSVGELVKEDNESGDIPIRPSLKLTSAMYELANEYSRIKLIENGFKKVLAENRVSDNAGLEELEASTLNPEVVNDESETTENETIRDEAGDAVDIPVATNSVDNRNGKEIDLVESSPEATISTSSDKSRALSYLANYLFLLHFRNSKIEQEQIDGAISLIGELVGSTEIDETAVKIVVKGIQTFYRSHRNIYLPLSISE